MDRQIIKVCSPHPRASVQNNHSKGHQHWRKDTWHIATQGDSRTWCGRDCSDYLRIGAFNDGDASDFHLCSKCGAKADA